MNEIIVNKLIKMEKYISELEKFKPDTFKEVPFGTGTVDFVKLFSKLNSLNYEGPFLIEMWADNSQEYNFEKSVKKIKEAKNWVESKMAKGGLL